MNKTICVFCAVNDVDQKYIDAAGRLGQLMSQRKYDLVWGGSYKGLMKIIADSVQSSGGKIIGITVEFLKDSRCMTADEMTIAKDLPERKKLLGERSDAVMLLPGGIGSLDEFTEILELKKHDKINKPLVVLNTDTFYSGLKSQLERMKQEKFITKDLEELVFFADTPEQALEYISTAL